MNGIKNSSVFKKYIFGIFLLFGLAMATVAVTSIADQATENGITYTYTVSNNTANITKVEYNDSTIKTVTIPAQLGDKNVTSIGGATDNPINATFCQLESLESVVIPENVTSIGQYTFAHCENLKNITFPSALTSIETKACYECAKIKNLTIPPNVSSIGNGAFATCEKLETIFIPNITISADYIIVPETTTIYKYEVALDQTGASTGETLVEIVSAEKNEGSVSGACIEPDAMGGNYVISSVDSQVGRIKKYVKISIVPTKINSTQITETNFDVHKGDTITYTIKMGPVENFAAMQLQLNIPNGLNYAPESGQLVEDIETTLNLNIDPSSGNHIIDTTNSQVNPENTQVDFATFNNDNKRIVIYGGNYTSNNDTDIATFTCTVDNKAAEGVYNILLTEHILVANDATQLPEDISNLKSTVTVGHDWNNPTYSWKKVGDDWTCIANRVCRNDVNHVETETATVANGNLTSTEKTAATCTTVGTTTYTATFENTAFATQTKDENDIPATGHSYGSATYSWEKVGNEWNCTATRVCGNDSSHIETETVTATSEVKTAATCEVDGITTYTAEFENEAFAEQTKDENDIPLLGHDWNNPTYSWEKVGNDWKCTATRVCTNDASHTETETVTATSTIKTAATCEGVGTTTYTATFTNTAFAEQTKDVDDITAIGHAWGNPTSYTWTQENGSWICTATRICENNESHINNTESVIVTPYVEKYDENAHGLTVNNGITNGTVKYSEDQTTWTEECPTYTAIGNYTVYVKVEDTQSQVSSKPQSVTIEILMPYDINQDGDVNVLDAQIVFNYLARIKTLNDKELIIVDGDKDGKVNLNDINNMVNLILTK